MDRIKSVARYTQDTYVVTNNHNLGKAVANAFELSVFLSGKPIHAPEPLTSYYPELKRLGAGSTAQ